MKKLAMIQGARVSRLVPAKSKPIENYRRNIQLPIKNGRCVQISAAPSMAINTGLPENRTQMKTKITSG
jgi:hypothetical protein